jgi:hypothetical protein
MFTHSDPAMANVFMPGDGDGVSERMVGRTVSKEACMERVKQLEPGANGATYLEHPDFDGGVSHQACTSFVLPWPLPVVETAEVASVVTDPGVATRAVPCFFSSSAGHDNGMPFSMTRFILIALSPVLCTLIPTAYYSVAKLQASRNDEIALKGDDTHSSYTDRTVAAVVCLIFVIYPTVVKSTFSMFTCVDLEAGYCSVAPAEHLTAAKCEKAGGMWSAGKMQLKMRTTPPDHPKWVHLSARRGGEFIYPAQAKRMDTFVCTVCGIF